MYFKVIICARSYYKLFDISLALVIKSRRARPNSSTSSIKYSQFRFLDYIHKPPIPDSDSLTRKYKGFAPQPTRTLLARLENRACSNTRACSHRVGNAE